jgi:tetratricopeptide (TPR) repeat protein
VFFRRGYLLAIFAAVSVLTSGAASGHQTQSQPAQGQAAAPAKPAEGQPTAPKKDWKDRAEYDLFAKASAAVQATPPDYKTALDALNDWKTKYPSTSFDLERQQLFFSAYEGLGQFDKAVEAGDQALKIDPKDIHSLYNMTLLAQNPKVGNLTAGMQISIEKAAQTLATDIDSLKPAKVSDAEWKKDSGTIRMVAWMSLGWLAKQKPDNVAAEKAFKEVLKINPGNAQVDVYVGTAILAQKNPDTQSEALFYFARAAALGQKGMMDYVTKTYTTYHGSDEGLKDVLALAKANPLPPAGFKILTAVEVEAKKQEELQKNNPELALWLEIKKQLTSPEGEQYFSEHMKDAAVPELTGYLVSQKLAKGPAKELVLAMSDSKTPEVTLKLTEGSSLSGVGDVGSKISFEGIPAAYVKEPFMVTFDVDKAKIKGWTGKAAPVRPKSKAKAKAKSKATSQ